MVCTIPDMVNIILTINEMEREKDRETVIDMSEWSCENIHFGTPVFLFTFGKMPCPSRAEASRDVAVAIAVAIDIASVGLFQSR